MKSFKKIINLILCSVLMLVSVSGCGGGNSDSNSADTSSTSHEHYYSKTVVEPTCTEQGYTIYTCVGCDDRYVGDYTNALEHDWLKATCTIAQTCAVCGITRGETTGHQWNKATCTTPKTCSVCNTTEGNALGHTWSVATCTTPKTCSVCGKTDGEALGHTWDNATCTTAKTCSVCNTTVGNALGHSWNKATCTTPKTCSVCGTTEGNALGHTWNEATCSVPKTCSVCGKTEGKATEHTWVEATCTAPKTCSVCDTTEGEALEHSWNSDGLCDNCGSEITYKEVAANIKITLKIPHVGSSSNSYANYYLCNNFENVDIVVYPTFKANGYLLYTEYVKDESSSVRLADVSTKYTLHAGKTVTKTGYRSIRYSDAYNSKYYMYLDNSSEASLIIMIGDLYFTLYFGVSGMTKIGHK